MRGIAPRQFRLAIWPLAVVLIMLAAVIWPQKAQDTLYFVLTSFFDVAPIIAIGILLSAWVAASGAATITAKWFAGRPGVTIVLASAMGAATPVCGVTALPLMTGFLAAGVPLAPVMAFWLSSPVTDPAMFAVTWAVLGPAFAIGKVVAAFGLGLFAGAGTALLSDRRVVQQPLRAAWRANGGQCNAMAGFQAHIWRESARMRAFWAEALAMTRLIALCLTFAFAAEFLLRDLLPPQVLASYVGQDSALAIPLAVLVGAPIYLDGYAALPLVRGLLDLGMSPGAALAFLVSGGAVSIWGVLAVVAVLRPATIALFIGFAVTGSVAIGYAFDVIWRMM